MAIDKLLHHYSMTSPASVYDEEAVTAIELAARTTAKVNEVIDAENAFEKRAGETIENIPNVVDANVQKYIRDGKFDRAIDRYAGELEARVDNLIANTPEGSTTMDAEIIDARLGDNGNVYPNLRSSIRGQIKRDIAKFAEIDHKNRFDPSTITVGVYTNPQTGAFDTNASYNTTDFIPVKEGEEIHFNHNLRPYAIRFATFHTETGAVLPDFVETVNRVTVPTGASLMRVSYERYIVDPSKFMISTPYYGYKNISFGEKFNYTEFDLCMYEIAHTNRYNPATVVENAYVSHLDGRTTHADYTSYVSTDFIPILPGETLKFCYANMNPQSIRMAAAYDENHNFVEGVENITEFTQHGNIKYIRLSIKTNLRNNTMVCGLDTITYHDYGQYTIKGLKESSAQINSALGGESSRLTAESLEGGASLTHSEFPAYLKNNMGISFRAKISSFSSLTIGHGKLGNEYSSLWYEITATTITVKKYYKAEQTLKTIEHGLTITDFIDVLVSYDGLLAYITIVTKDGYFTDTHNGGDACGTIFATLGNSMTDIVFSVTCADLSKPLWMVGDSYFGYSSDRVMGQLKKLGYGNFLCLAQPGLSSSRGLADVIKCLSYGTPKIMVWYMGMNDGATADMYRPYLTQLKQICQARNILLILNKVPSVPTISKEEIGETVMNSGLRYIDSYAAVGANASGVWYEGALSNDGVHPTEYGARLLAAQILVDVPEVMSYGRCM